MIPTSFARSLTLVWLGCTCSFAAEPTSLPRATIDRTGPGWKDLAKDDFVNVNTADDTWTWKERILRCTGKPVGVLRTAKPYTNFEMVVQWVMREKGGNSGVFVWVPETSLKNLKPNQLPHGIEVQVLDHGYTEQYEKSSGKKADWFTTNGDVFPVGKTKMKPFPPVSPDGSRSFPRKNLSKGVNEWNHYYIIAKGHHIQAWLNGVKTIDIVHEGGFLDGNIGLQLCHGKQRYTVIDVKAMYVKEL